MFSKLLKHEWKANAGLLGILSACALGAGLLGAFALRGIIYMSGQLENENAAALGISGLSSALVFIVVALAAYAFAVQFITLFRFYKNKFTDEGYLTFTLPVSAGQIFLSSFLNILAWLVISGLVVIAAVSMILFIGAAEPLKEYVQEIQFAMGNLSGWVEEEMLGEPGYRAYCVLASISTVIAPVYSVLLLMTSITIGSVLAKKHKILATIGMYYCINFGVSIVESTLAVVPTIILGMNEEIYVFYASTSAITLLLQIGLGIGGYFLSTHLMKRKLNLP